MCRLCDLWGVEHEGTLLGKVKRYYFNPDVYDPDLLFEDMRWVSQVACWAATFELQRAEFGAYDNSLTTHRHQLMSLREMLDTLEFINDLIKKGELPGGEFAVSVCGCKYTTMGVQEYTCMTWEPIPLEEIGWFVREQIGPYPRQLLKRLTYEEIRDLLVKCEMRGFVHNFDIMKGEGEDMPWCPWVCNCEYPSCHSLRARILYGWKQDIHRSHYVAVPDTQICNGCRQCVPWCQFGAIHVQEINKKVTINPLKCMGCGQCQTHCPLSDWRKNEGAIKMVDRDEVLVAPRQVYA